MRNEKIKAIETKLFLVLFALFASCLLFASNFVFAEDPFLTITKNAEPRFIVQNWPINVSITLTPSGDPLSTRLPLDAFILIDTSGSMLLNGVPQPGIPAIARIDAAGIAANALLDNLDAAQDRAGLITFTPLATVKNQLTNAFGSGSSIRDNIQNIAAIGSGKDTGAAIGNASFQLSNAQNPRELKVILLITDQAPTCPVRDTGNPAYAPHYCINVNQGDIDNMVAAAQLANSAGQRIYVIHVGVAGVEPSLQEVASITNGRYYSIPTPTNDNMADVINQIVSLLQLTAATNIAITDTIPANVIVNPSTLSPECKLQAGTVFCSIDRIDFPPRPSPTPYPGYPTPTPIPYVVSFNVSTSSLGAVATNQNLLVTYTAANRSYQSCSSQNPPNAVCSVPNPVINVIPQPEFTVEPSEGYGPFPADLTAAFTYLPGDLYNPRNYQAYFDCGLGGQPISKWFSVTSGNLQLPTLVTQSCTYPVVEPPNSVTYTPKLVGLDYQWGPYFYPVYGVYRESRVIDKPRQLKVEALSPSGIVPHSSVTFDAICFSPQISSGSPLDSCTCRAYYRHETQPPQQYLDVALPITFGGGSMQARTPHYMTTLDFRSLNLPLGHFYYYVQCSYNLQTSLQATSQVRDFRTYLGDAFMTLAATPFDHVGPFPSTLRATVNNIPTQVRSIYFDCNYNQQTGSAPVTWTNQYTGYAEKICDYPLVFPTPTTFIPKASMTVPQVGDISAATSVNDRPREESVRIEGMHPFSGDSVTSPVTFRVLCFVDNSNPNPTATLIGAPITSDGDVKPENPSEDAAQCTSCKAYYSDQQSREIEVSLPHTSGNTYESTTPTDLSVGTYAVHYNCSFEFNNVLVSYQDSGRGLFNVILPIPTPPTPSYTPQPISFLNAICPTSLVLGNTANVTGYLYLNGTPECLLDAIYWQINLTMPNGTYREFSVAPQSCVPLGYNQFVVGTPDKGRYTVDLVAYPNDPAFPEIVSLSSSCSFSVLPQPPSQFPDVPLFVVALAALGVFVFLARFKKRKR